MSNHSETYKSPYSLLNLKPDSSLSSNWAEFLRKRRKEILAEFDLHQSPSLSFEGQSWTRSEVLAGFEELSRGTESYHHAIWERGWLEFWKGGKEIPGNMSQKATWSGKYQQALWDDFEKIISQRLQEYIRAEQFPAILELLSFSFAVPSSVLKKAEAPISALLLEERREWRGRAFKIRPKDELAEYQEWYPARYVALFCQLPERYEEESRRWAQAVIDISVVLARYLTFEQRNEILVLAYPASNYWPEDLKSKWNRFQQYLSVVPQADSVVQKTIFYKRKILMIIGISLGFGILGYFLGKRTYTPPVDYRNLSIEYFPTDSVLSPGFQPDTFELTPYHSNGMPTQFPNASEDSTSQSIP